MESDSRDGRRSANRHPGGRWHDRSSPFRGRRQYSVIANQMVFRTRDEGGDFFQPILWIVVVIGGVDATQRQQMEVDSKFKRRTPPLQSLQRGRAAEGGRGFIHGTFCAKLRRYCPP